MALSTSTRASYSSWIPSLQSIWVSNDGLGGFEWCGFACLSNPLESTSPAVSCHPLSPAVLPQCCLLGPVYFPPHQSYSSQTPVCPTWSLVPPPLGHLTAEHRRARYVDANEDILSFEIWVIERRNDQIMDARVHGRHLPV